MTYTRFLMFAAASLVAAPTLACTADAAGDFEPTYVGPQLAGIDIRCAGVRLVGDQLIYEVTLADSIEAAESSYVVWGVNRGQGVPRLQFIGAPPPIKPDVLFDAILIARRDGVAELGLFAGMMPPAFTFHPDAVTIDGNIVRTILPVALFPENGFSAWQFRYTAWSHFEADGAGFSISNVWKADFTDSFGASVPEPASWALMISGFGLVGGILRRRQSLTLAGDAGRAWPMSGR